MHPYIESLFTRLRSSPRQVIFVVAGVFVLCFLTVLTAHHGNAPTSQLQKRERIQALATDRQPADSPIDVDEEKMMTRQSDAGAALLKSNPQTSPYGDFRTEPRIAYSADLGVITKDFVHARSSMEEILDRHRGYAARLRMIGNPNGNSLSATLKVPASEYSSTLADLKSVGDVQTDDESADEVIQQHGDLEARLQNARNNIRRLEQLLKESTDKSIDVEYVQRQLVVLRSEVAKLELERHNVDSRVVFSNIHFSLREVRETPAETLSAQFRHAAASGLTDLIASLSAIVLFLIGYGPSFLLWAAILFFPARYLWRRVRISTEAHQAAV